MRTLPTTHSFSLPFCSFLTPLLCSLVSSRPRVRLPKRALAQSYRSGILPFPSFLLLGSHVAWAPRQAAGGASLLNLLHRPRLRRGVLHPLLHHDSLAGPTIIGETWFRASFWFTEPCLSWARQLSIPRWTGNAFARST